MSEDLFGDPEQQTTESNATTTEAPATPAVKPEEPVDPNSLFADQLSGIVADDGRQKYADVKTALASIPHAQQHIQSLSDKIKELETDLAKRNGMEELMQSLQDKPNQQATETPSVAGLDEATVLQLIEATRQKERANETAAANANSVKQALAAKFGDKAKEAFAQKAQELGMTVGTLTDLAKTSPKAVEAFFNGSQVRDAQPTTGGAPVVTTTTKDNMPDYERRFRQGDTVLSDKWERAKQNALKKLNGEN